MWCFPEVLGMEYLRNKSDKIRPPFAELQQSVLVNWMWEHISVGLIQIELTLCVGLDQFAVNTKVKLQYLDIQKL